MNDILRKRKLNIRRSTIITFIVAVLIIAVSYSIVEFYSKYIAYSTVGPIYTIEDEWRYEME